MSCKRDDRWTVHSPESWRGSLASRVVTLEDRGREIESRLGFRPYSLWVVQTVWAGGRRGNGHEEVVQEVAILPNPKISDLTGIQLMVTPAMVQEQGTILVSGISGRYTEDQLMAKAPDGTPEGQQVSTWWEVMFLPGCGPGSGERIRFASKSRPNYDPDVGAWAVTLTRSYEGRARSGLLR